MQSGSKKSKAQDDSMKTNQTAKKSSAKKTPIDSCCQEFAFEACPTMTKNEKIKTAKTPSSKAKGKTKITVTFDCGFPNTLFIRGQGVKGLNWDKGLPLKNTKSNEWTFETEASFSKIEFKVLLNDAQYECGENHILECGKQLNFTPSFS